MAKRLYPLKQADHTISSGYGPRDGDFHYGLDFAAKDGTPFYACQAGTVQYIGEADGYGQWIVIDSDDSEGSGCLEYGHMWNAFATGLKVGSHVEAGQLIGYVGSNGQATGPHLHLSVHEYDYRSAYVDPAVWLKGSGYPGSATVPTPSTPSTSGASVATKPAFRDIELMGNNRDSRYSARIIYIFLHTEDGASVSAEALVRSGNASGSFSYHNIFDNNTRVAMVDTDYGSWSVLDANAYSINYCFAGSRAAQSRQVWIDKFRNAIRIAAWTAVEDVKKYGYIGKIVNPGQKYPKGRVPCIADHFFVTKILGIGTHTDVGPNFPWDLFESDFLAYLTGAATPEVPPVNKINEEAGRAKAWIGNRKDKDEQNCRKDGGKFVRYDNATIYWSPASGAHAIPSGGKDSKGNDIPDLMSVYAKYDWENGYLGFPIGDHTTLTDKAGNVVGGVQGFQGGAIYRQKKDGKWLDGHPVQGKIRDFWNKSGFENGSWGWPLSDEFGVKGGARYQIFEGGRLVWAPPSTGNVVGLLTQDGQDTIV